MTTKYLRGNDVFNDWSGIGGHEDHSEYFNEMDITVSNINYCGISFWFPDGLGSGLWNNVLSVWLMEIWGPKSAPFLQLSQCMYGIGTIFGLLIARPYLTGENDNDMKFTAFNSTDVLIDGIDRRSKIKIPFLINGLVQITFPIILVLMFVFKRYRKPEQIYEDTKECTVDSIGAKVFDRKDSPRVLMIILTVIYLATYNAFENMFFAFSTTYFQYFSLKLSASKSAEIASAMALTYTIGRGISTFIAIKIKPQHMIAYHFLILIISLILLILSEKSIIILWIANVMIGFGFSAMTPAFYAYILQYMDITDRIGSIFMFSNGSINSFAPFILGIFIEDNPISFIIGEAVYLVINIVFFIIIYYMIERLINQYKS